MPSSPKQSFLGSPQPICLTARTTTSVKWNGKYNYVWSKPPPLPLAKMTRTNLKINKTKTLLQFLTCLHISCSSTLCRLVYFAFYGVRWLCIINLKKDTKSITLALLSFASVSQRKTKRVWSNWSWNEMKWMLKWNIFSYEWFRTRTLWYRGNRHFGNAILLISIVCSLEK